MTPAQIVQAYTPAFRATMVIDDPGDPAALTQALHALSGPARDLLDMLWISAGTGAALDPRFRPQIESLGEPLWRSGLLLPRSVPRGATLDPRYFAGACRLNPALPVSAPFERALLPVDAAPAFPASDARVDSVVVAASLERTPARLKQDGGTRRDLGQRLERELGDSAERWELALRLAQATGLARPAGAKLLGYPEARPRRLTEPVGVLPEDLRTAGQALLRLIGSEWVALDALSQVLHDRAREVLYSASGPVYASRGSQAYDATGWARVEDAELRAAAAVLHRLRVFDAAMDEGRVCAVRTAQKPPRVPPGFLLTPDLDVYVAAGELRSADYGRLARVAPFVEGARVHRHRLTRAGVAADLAAGNADLVGFLTEFSRTGVPDGVRQSIAHWSASAQRVTLLTGVTVREDADGRLQIAPAEPTDRVLDYSGAVPAPAVFQVQDDVLRVPYGQDALTVRAALSRVARADGHDADGWLFALEPRAVDGVEALLAQLQAYAQDGVLPGALEISVRAAQGELPEVEAHAAVLLRLPGVLADALSRDPSLRALLARPAGNDQYVVERAELPTLRARLLALGVGLSEIGVSS